MKLDRPKGMMMLALAGSLAAAAALAQTRPQLSVRTERPTGAYRVCYLTLDGVRKDRDGDEPYRTDVFLAMRDGRIVTGLVPRDVVTTDVSAMKLSGRSLSGEVLDRQVGRQPGIAYRYRIDARVADERVSGTFSGQFRHGNRRRTVQGTVMGKIVGADALSKRNAIGGGAAWGAWSGPLTKLIAPQSDARLVKTFREARLLWKGEEEIPGSPGRSGGLVRKLMGVPTTRITGGGASPVVAGGKVYLRYHVPSGDVLDKRALDRLTGEYGEDFANRRKILVGADDVVICLDAATGQLLWKTVFEDTAFNLQEHKTNIMNLTPCVHEGRVYAVTGTGRVLCLDGASGKLIWAGDVGARHTYLENLRKQSIETATYAGYRSPNRSWGTAPIVAGGVLVTGDTGSTLVGLALKDGRLLWQVKGVMHGNCVPQRWAVGGTEYAVVAGRGGVTAVRPQSGGILWNAKIPLRAADSMFAIRDELLVVMQTDPKAWAAAETDEQRERLNKSGPIAFAGYRVTAGGAEHIWTAPGPGRGGHSIMPIVAGGFVYVSDDRATRRLDARTGRELTRVAVAGAGNAGHLFLAGDRLVICRDGKHGVTDLRMIDVSGEKLVALDASWWSPPNPNTTSYHTFMTYPIVDGRLFVRGGDAVYCYDLRRSTAPREQTIRLGPIENQPAGAGPVNLDVSATSGLPVSVRVLRGPARAEGHTLILAGEGIVTVVATQPGNRAFRPAPPVTHHFAVGDAAPSPARAVVARATSSTTAIVTWKHRGRHTSGFLVQRSTGEGSWQTVGRADRHAREFRDRGLRPASEVRYRVIAREKGVRNLFCPRCFAGGLAGGASRLGRAPPRSG
jgi:outer membrane protein assembly factor BamB